MDKRKLFNILLIGALVALIIVVIVTSIVLNQRKIKRDELKAKNDNIKDLIDRGNEGLINQNTIQISDGVILWIK